MVKVLEEAEQDLEKFGTEVSNKILDEIEKRLGNGVDSKGVTVIKRPSYDAVFHRLKLTKNGLDHRVYFDYKDSELYVFAVRHRDRAYSREDLKESVKRLQDMG